MTFPGWFRADDWLRTAAEEKVAAARLAQADWKSWTLRRRLDKIRKVRHALVESAGELLDLIPDSLDRTRTDTLTAEVLPLADACRFLEREAERILRTRRLRATWTRRVEIELVREPMGVVLVIGPANYPLFLPAVQTLQALAAGNAVLWKPGHGGAPIARAVALLVRAAGVPENVLQVLDESPQAGLDAIAEGVDKVAFTGSLKAGKAVLMKAAEQVTPAIAELSGNDPVIVHQTADLERAAGAIAFGLRFNGGNTCIVPQRLIAHHSIARRLEMLLSVAMNELPKLPILRFDDDSEAIEIANLGPYALGASVFARPPIARQLAAKLMAGVVVVNDVIVPTADARLPFGGRRLSGFGKTRGEEGLFEFTALKAIATQRARRLLHTEPLPNHAEDFFLHYLAARNGAHLRERLAGWKALAKTVVRMRKRT